MIQVVAVVVMADQRKPDQLSGCGRFGELVAGTVKAVVPHGVFVDIGLDHVGHIDPIYIDPTDFFDIGDHVIVYLDGFSKLSKQYRLRPPGKTTMREWLQEDRDRVFSPESTAMPVSLAVQNRIHEPVSWITEGLDDLVPFAMRLPENSIMRGISPYGDTIFNVVQLRFLMLEIDRLEQSYPERTDVLHVVKEAAKTAISMRGYLMFSGS